MKKVFTLLAMLLTSFTTLLAAGTVTYTPSARSTYNGWEKDLGTATVEITDEGDDNYTLVYRQFTVGNFMLGDWTAEHVTGSTDEDGVVSLSFNGNATISNSTDRGALAMGFRNGTEQSMKFDATIKDGKLSMTVTVTVSGREGVVILGDGSGQPDEPDEPDNPDDGTAVVYTGPALVQYPGSYREYKDTKVEITDNGGGKYTVVYRQLTIQDQTIADYTITGVSGTTDAHGVTHYSFSGQAKLSKIDDFVGRMFGIQDGDQQPLIMEGESKDGQLYAQFNTTWNRMSAVITFGLPISSDEDEALDSVTYTADAASYFRDHMNWTEDVQLQVKDFGDGDYTFVYYDLRAGLNPIADYTAEHVKGTLRADGCMAYTFDGRASVNNLHLFGQQAGMTETSLQPLTINAISKNGLLAGTFITIARGDTVRVEYGDSVAVINGGSAGVSGIVDDMATMEQVYNLAGQRRQHMESGVNIVRRGNRTYKVFLRKD